ncbi:DUF4238 domain-containing protein [Bacillus bombysepticus]|uniref:DUF4238 domain-containing protein n=1 Tax=Bacillus bombysepticus TaxID=658666 RepID=UPI0030186DED
MVKRQHYVPRFYLKYFGEKDKVNYFDKNQQKTITNIHVDNVAQQKYFYDFSEEFLELQKNKTDKSTNKEFFDKQFLEVHFSKLEDGFAKAFRSINEKINANDDLLNSDINTLMDAREKVAIAFFIALQSIRTPHYRELSNNFFNASSILENLMNDPNERLLMSLASGILDRVSGYLLSDKFDWYIAVIGEGTKANKESVSWKLRLMDEVIIHDEFLLSDNPVVNINHIKEKSKEHWKEFCLPITAKQLLIIREKGIPWEVPNNSIFIPDRSLVKFYNDLQIRCATRKVIYKNKTNAKKLSAYFKCFSKEETHFSGMFYAHKWD